MGKCARLDKWWKKTLPTKKKHGIFELVQLKVHETTTKFFRGSYAVLFLWEVGNKNTKSTTLLKDLETLKKFRIWAKILKTERLKLKSSVKNTKFLFKNYSKISKFEKKHLDQESRKKQWKKCLNMNFERILSHLFLVQLREY